MEISCGDCFRRKCVTKSGQAVQKTHKYIYADIMEFLRPTMLNRTYVTQHANKS